MSLMKRRSSLFGFFFLINIIATNLIIYFTIKLFYTEFSFEFKIIRICTILIFNMSFYFFMFLIDIDVFKKMTIFIIVIGTCYYAYTILWQFLPFLPIFWNLYEVVVFSVYAIVPFGIIFYILHYIKNDSAKYGDLKFGGKYHIHESFLGVVLLICAIFISILRFILISYKIFLTKLYFVFQIVTLFLFFFYYFASFLMFRDWRDIIHFRFIEKKKKMGLNNTLSYDTVVFNNLSKEDVPFFESPKLKMFPLAILLTSISLSTVIYGLMLFPSEIFYLNYEIISIIGYIFGFIAGGMLGKDWFRLLRKFYPELSYEIENVINKLKNQ